MPIRQFDSEKRLELLKSLTSFQQIIKEPRIDAPPSSINKILAISKETSETRSKIARAKVGDMPEGEWRKLWYANREISIRLLRQFAEEQIKSAILTAGKWEKSRLGSLLSEVQERHPFDLVIHLLSTEPMLMLSNLDAEQVVALYNLCTQLEQGNPALRLYAVALLSQKI